MEELKEREDWRVYLIGFLNKHTFVGINTGDDRDGMQRAISTIGLFSELELPERTVSRVLSHLQTFANSIFFRTYLSHRQ